MTLFGGPRHRHRHTGQEEGIGCETARPEAWPRGPRCWFAYSPATRWCPYIMHSGTSASESASLARVVWFVVFRSSTVDAHDPAIARRICIRGILAWAVRRGPRPGHESPPSPFSTSDSLLVPRLFSTHLTSNLPDISPYTSRQTTVPCRSWWTLCSEKVGRGCGLISAFLWCRSESGSRRDLGTLNGETAFPRLLSCTDSGQRYLDKSQSILLCRL